MWHLLDLFSGLGGFVLGLEKAGFKFKKHYSSEIDKYAIAVYNYHFKEAEYVGDVRHVCGSELRKRKSEMWIVTFGFPCQDLSIAGKRKGFGGERSSLFFEAIRIINELRPDYFIAENVKGFFSSHDGRDFKVALQAIADIGYNAQWQLLNTE